jgi:4,5-DOPA dioxygenase extradiol
MRQPAIFFGHGNPMNALKETGYAAEWMRLGKQMQKPEAILAISAHWFVPGIRVTANEYPPTIHDFGGFPKTLYDIRYPAPGNPGLARRVQALLAPSLVAFDASWGLDHGTWSVLRHVFPEADVPVIQLSIDATQPAAFHFKLGRRIAHLRDENILILGSGNVVHNLQSYRWGQEKSDPYDWAVRFESRVKEVLLAGDYESLLEYEQFGPEAELAVPTLEHFLPLLYIAGAQKAEEKVLFPVEGIEGGSISMLAVRIGA